MQNSSQGDKGKTRNLVAQKMGIGSGRQYKKKFIDENANKKLW